MKRWPLPSAVCRSLGVCQLWGNESVSGQSLELTEFPVISSVFRNQGLVPTGLLWEPACPQSYCPSCRDHKTLRLHETSFFVLETAEQQTVKAQVPELSHQVQVSAVWHWSSPRISQCLSFTVCEWRSSEPLSPNSPVLNLQGMSQKESVRAHACACAYVC